MSVTDTDIPPNTPIMTLKIEFATGRWATLVVPYDMTTAEVTHLQAELYDLSATALAEAHDSASRAEAADPKTAERKSWK